MITFSKRLGSVVLLTVYVLLSCEKSDKVPLSDATTKYDLLMSLDAKEVANHHNKVLSDIREYQSEHSKASLKSSLIGTNNGLSEEEIDEIIRWVESTSVDEMDQIIKNNLNSDQALVMYKEIDDVVKKEFSNPYRLKSTISNLLENAKLNVTNQQDLQIIQIFGETAIASSEFWYGQDSDKNLSLKAFKNTKRISNKERSDWVTADGKGAAGASISWAIGAAVASGPVAPATYFLAVGVSAAMASIMS